jgi:hypothetical protein
MRIRTYKEFDVIDGDDCSKPGVKCEHLFFSISGWGCRKLMKGKILGITSDGRIPKWSECQDAEVVKEQ